MKKIHQNPAPLTNDLKNIKNTRYSDNIYVFHEIFNSYIYKTSIFLSLLHGDPYLRVSPLAL